MPEDERVKTTMWFGAELHERVKRRASVEKSDMRSVVANALEVYLSIEAKEIEEWTARRYDILYGPGTSRAKFPLIDPVASLQYLMREGLRSDAEAAKPASSRAARATTR